MRRQEALALFQRAAQGYVAAAPDLPLDQQGGEVFDVWFYAALGACDLSHLDERVQAAPGQAELIRAALTSLPGEVGERHLATFANNLFTRLSAVNPAVKFRFLRSGFAVIGDHPQAHEAAQVLEYYEDLVTEIELVARVDGGDAIGTTEPFLVHVDLRHTREIERESGGFRKYLQNQQNQTYSYYNYGRPPENYRDKFEQAARTALADTFEVESVTFNSEQASSKAEDAYGWRRTPYACLLLRAKGPQVDRIPPLRLDLDFLDTSGYVVLPVESAAVPVVAREASSEPRPYRELAVTQTLDERRAERGELVLEIKATAQGLVPGLEHIVELAPSQFDVSSTEDQGVSVSRFADDQESVVSERTWLVKLEAKRDLPATAKTF
jgi:hypothetical protein